MKKSNWPSVTFYAMLVVGIGCSPLGGGKLRVANGTPIVFVSVDTLRSDRLPAYGYQGVETPAIDSLRQDGILFERAYTHVPLTLPAHASLLSGQLPNDHGVRDNLGYTVDSNRSPLLQRKLKNAGYSTGAGISAFVLRRATGLSDGFDLYEDSIEVGSTGGLQEIQRSGFETLDAVRPWLQSVFDRPFFLFFHIFEPHTPYQPPEPFASRYESAYDGEVAAADAVVGALMAELKSLGVYEKALVVFLSDHGEGLGEHGEEEHGVLLYRTTLQVPLIVKLPKAERFGQTIARPVQLVDVWPTVVSALDLPVPKSLPGIPLLDHRESAAEHDVIYAETWFPRLHCGWSELTSLISGRFHFIEGPDPELFDLDEDPDENNNLVDTEPNIVSGLRELVNGYDRRFVVPMTESGDVRRRLQALGYVGEATGINDGNLPDPKSRIGVMRELRVAYREFSDGNFGQAVAAFQRIVQEEPGIEDGWEYLALSLAKSGRLQEAIETIDAALQTVPNSTRLAMSASALFFQVGRMEDARGMAERAVMHDPAAAHSILAKISLKAGDLDKAEGHAREAMRSEDRRPGPRLVYADVLVARGSMNEAADLLERTLAEGITAEAVRSKLASIYSDMGRFDEAETVLLGLMDSTSPETLMVLGRIAAHDQRWEEATRLLERALEADSSNPKVKINLGMLALTQNRVNDARRFLEEGVADSPDSAEGWNALGVCRVLANDHEGAISAWKMALEINPRLTDVLFNIGVAYAQVGDYARAADSMETFAKDAVGENQKRALGLAEEYRMRAKVFDLGIR